MNQRLSSSNGLLPASVAAPGGWESHRLSRVQNHPSHAYDEAIDRWTNEGGALGVSRRPRQSLFDLERHLPV